MVVGRVLRMAITRWHIWRGGSYGASRGSDGSEDVVIVRNVCHGMVVR